MEVCLAEHYETERSHIESQVERHRLIQEDEKMNRKDATRRVRETIASFVDSKRDEILEIIFDRVKEEESTSIINTTQTDAQRLCDNLQNEIDYLYERSIPMGER